MKQRITLLLVVLLASVGFAALPPKPLGEGEQLLEKYFAKDGGLSAEGKALVGQINANSEKLPFFAKALLGSENANIAITFEGNKTETIGIAMKNGKITAVKIGGMKNASITASAKEKTARTIALAKDPENELAKAIKAKEIRVSASGFMAKIKLWLVLASIGAN